MTQTDLPLVVSGGWLRAALARGEAITLIDLSARDAYEAGHIPGALHLPANRLLRGEGPVPNLIPTTAQISALVSEYGLDPASPLVAYDDQYGPWAGRLVWTLHQAGFRQLGWLDGQLQGWLEAGGALERQPNRPVPARRQIRPQLHWRIDKEGVLAALASRPAIWDARSPEEYRGEKIVNARRGGHIPGARNLEWTTCFRPDKPGFLRPEWELRALLAQQGWQPDQPLITHCQTHRRSGLTYIVARHLGYDRVQCYDGSWFEWGNSEDTPIEGETRPS